MWFVQSNIQLEGGARNNIKRESCSKFFPHKVRLISFEGHNLCNQYARWQIRHNLSCLSPCFKQTAVLIFFSAKI